MSRPRLKKPNPAIERLCREAGEAWGRQDYQKAISLIEQAAHKEPFDPFLLLELARAYGRRYDFPAAERYLEKAVQISEDRAHTLEEAGRTCLKGNKAHARRGVPAAHSGFPGGDQHPPGARLLSAQPSLPRARKLFPLRRAASSPENRRPPASGQEPGVEFNDSYGGASFPRDEIH